MMFLERGQMLTDRMIEKRDSHLSKVDQMTPDLRRAVCEYGLPIVEVLTKHGIKKATHIDEIVSTLWMGGRSTTQKNGVWAALDVLLGQNIISAQGLIAFLQKNNVALVPVSPTDAMLEASMETVSDFTRKITKAEKHKLRIEAALRAGMNEVREIGEASKYGNRDEIVFGKGA